MDEGLSRYRIAMDLALTGSLRVGTLSMVHDEYKRRKELRREMETRPIKVLSKRLSSNSSLPLQLSVTKPTETVPYR